MSVLDTSCLYSTLKNTSGGRKTFGFLPPHGRSLAANEEFTVFGDVHASLFRFERSEGRRNVIAFERAIQRGDITIVSTPAPIVLDVTTEESKMLQLDDGVVGVVDPCWFNSVSEAPLG